MKDKLLLIWKHLKPENLQKMWLQSKWIWQYGKRYWKSMVVYTLLGIAGSGVSLVSSFISKDLIDIITGHQTGKLLSTFAAMIGFSIANILFSQASTYASTFINLKVDSEIKNDIFAKMLVTDWESLTDYHTGDLVTRWSSDASNISSGILNWIPNLVIYIFRFISALFVVLYYDPTFALFALIGKFIDTIIPEEELPKTLTSYSPCFRKEKGAHGIEERGVYRIHQFEKQEMIVVCKPEESKMWYEKLWKNTVDLFRSMDIPVRTLECCSGDLADLKVKSVDVEAWSPRQKKYFEVGSCSNLGDAQARRLKIRINGENGKYFAHTLNNTVVAPPRMLIAFLENNLQADGSVKIPEVLQPYMGGMKVIEKK